MVNTISVSVRSVGKVLFVHYQWPPLAHFSDWPRKTIVQPQKEEGYSKGAPGKADTWRWSEKNKTVSGKTP